MSFSRVMNTFSDGRPGGFRLRKPLQRSSVRNQKGLQGVALARLSACDIEVGARTRARVKLDLMPIGGSWTSEISLQAGKYVVRSAK